MEYVEEIKKELDFVCSDPTLPGKNSAWTKAILKRISGLGKTKGRKFHVCATSRAENKADEGEWLYDLTWLRYDGDDHLLEVALALECEWDSKKLNEDFQKLLQARATLRVFIFQNARDALDGIIRQIEKFAGTMPGDEYLLVCYVEADNKFYFREYTHE